MVNDCPIGVGSNICFCCLCCVFCVGVCFLVQGVVGGWLLLST